MSIFLTNSGASLVLATGGVPLYTAVIADFYVSQTGGGDGSSPSSPLSMAWFNTAGNWANPKQSGKIGPGDVVALVGTITSNPTLQASGSVGDVITIDGTLGTLGTDAYVLTGGKSYWTVQNVTCADSKADVLISVQADSSYGVVENCTADNIEAGAIVWINQGGGGTSLAHHITIRDCYFRTSTTDNSNQRDLIVTEGSTNVTIEGCYLEMRAVGAGHNDLIQTYEKGGASYGNPSDWTLRHNYFVMNTATANDRSWCMLENLGGTNNVYGNVFVGLSGAGSANGFAASLSEAGTTFNIYNNTFVCKGSASNNVLNLVSTGTANLRNNVFHLQNQTALTGSMTVNRTYNLWYGTNVPSGVIEGEVYGSDPLFTDYTNNDFTLQAGSPARGSGTDLGASYQEAIAAGATWPNPALATRTGSWDRGAYEQ